jgi:hypothetical protein
MTIAAESKRKRSFIFAKFSKKVLQVRIIILPLLFTNLSATLQYCSVNFFTKKKSYSG